MTRKIKQYKPIAFGDRPDSDTVEGHRNAMSEAAETLHEDVIPSFQTTQYHQSSEFDRAIPDMNISDREASISASKLGWTSC